MSDEATKVVSLNGARIAPRGEPREDIIETLEELIAAARAGELDGVAIALQFENLTTSWRTAGRMTRATIGTLAMLQFSLMHDDMKESEANG